MVHRHRLVLALGVILTGLPLTGEAVQISPNPNPTGSILEIINDPNAFNALTPFTNEGRITIDATSSLTNQAGATLVNSFTPGIQSGRIDNSGLFTNNGTITSVVAVGDRGGSGIINLGIATNNGVISNNYIDNFGTFTNSASGRLIFDPTERPFLAGLLGNVGTWNNHGIVDNHYEIFNFGELVNTGTINTLSTGPSDASPGAIFGNQGTLTNSGVLNIALTGATGYAEFGNLVRINGLAAGLGYEITSVNGAQTLTITGAPVPVPEPSSLLLLGAGLLGLIGFRGKLSPLLDKE